MEKIAESLDRIFLIRVSKNQNGQQTITTANEVATMDFVGHLGFPVPKVLTWGSRAQLTEVDLVYKLAHLRLLLDLRFTHYESLYSKDDIDVSQRSTVDFLETIRNSCGR